MKKTKLVADWQTLTRTFIKPEEGNAKSILLKYMEQIFFELHDFLSKHVGITKTVSLKELSSKFTHTLINKNPEKKLADIITELIKNIAPNAVNISSPYFVGHMTSAIPFFMIHLKTIVAALNQNVVKIETSKVVSIMEKQVIAKIHRLIYKNDEAFYKKHVQNTASTLGCFTEDGTIANITALWVARNRLFALIKGKFGGIEQEGLQAAYKAHNIEKCVVLVSRLGHYSLKKAGGILGIGNKNIIPIGVDSKNKMSVADLNKTIQSIRCDSVKILAIVGIAGTTETGTIDPLAQIGEICAEHKIHFHIDAAWGGPTLMSEKYKRLLNGIELADSVTIDGHKQFYMPMSCGMIYFKDPLAMDAVAYHANYVNRQSSVDLGIKSLSGSREANSLILGCALRIMGKNGYGLLIDHGIETARKFAEEIEKHPDFELTTSPELNILTYRIYPMDIRKRAEKNLKSQNCINKQLNEINKTVQRLQRRAGKSFVSRTILKKNNHDIIVLRCVIMNPMTNIKILREILQEQKQIYKRNDLLCQKNYQYGKRCNSPII